MIWLSHSPPSGASIPSGSAFWLVHAYMEVEMPKYIVTGGQTGDATIEVAGKVYEVGDTVELKSSDWLVKQGYVASTAKKETK